MPPAGITPGSRWLRKSAPSEDLQKSTSQVFLIFLIFLFGHGTVPPGTGSRNDHAASPCVNYSVGA